MARHHVYASDWWLPSGRLSQPTPLFTLWLLYRAQASCWQVHLSCFCCHHLWTFNMDWKPGSFWESFRLSKPLWNCWGSQPAVWTEWLLCSYSLQCEHSSCWTDYLDYLVRQSNTTIFNVCLLYQFCFSREAWPIYRLCDLSLASSFSKELRIPTAHSGNIPSSVCILIFSCLGRVKKC